MHVATLRLDLDFSDCSTRAQKRKCLETMMLRLKLHLNVAVCEVEPTRSNAPVALGAATVARNRKEAHEILTRLIDAVTHHPLADVLGQIVIHDL